MWLNIHIYIYTHKQNQNNPTKIKYNRLTQWTKETQNDIYPEQKLLKHKVGNKIKARCQLGNKAMKIKLTNMLRGKERKNRHAKLNSGR